MARSLFAVNRTLSGVPPNTFNLKMKGYCYGQKMNAVTQSEPTKDKSI